MVGWRKTAPDRSRLMRCMDKYRRSVQTFVGSRDKTVKVDEIEEDPPEQDNIVQRFHDVVEAFTTVLVRKKNQNGRRERSSPRKLGRIFSSQQRGDAQPG